MMPQELLSDMVFLCLLVGVALGLLFMLIKIIRLVLGIRKIGELILDILFCLFSSLVVFLLALATNDGSLRFIVIALLLIGFISVFIVVDPFVNLISNKVNIMLLCIRKILHTISFKFSHYIKRRKESKSAKKAKKSKKNEKKAKNT